MLSANTQYCTFLEAYNQLHPEIPENNKYGRVNGIYPKNPKSYIGSMLCVKEADLGFKKGDGKFGCPKNAKNCEECWNLKAEFDLESGKFIRIVEGMAVLDGITV